MLEELEDDEAGRCPVCGAVGFSCREEALGMAVGVNRRSEGMLRSGSHGGITIRYRTSEGENPMHKLTARTYVNADSTKVVPEGHADAAYLLGNEGDEISAETAERLGLVGGTSAEEDAIAYDKLKKAEIVKLAEDRGVDSSGTIAEIAARLDEDDEKAKAAEVGAGGATGSTDVTAAPAPAGGTADVGSPEGTAATNAPA